MSPVFGAYRRAAMAPVSTPMMKPIALSPCSFRLRSYPFAGPSRGLEGKLAERHPSDGRQSEERQQKEVGEEAPPSEEQGDDRKDGAEFRTRPPRAPCKDQTNDACDRLGDGIGNARQQRQS